MLQAETKKQNIVFLTENKDGVQQYVEEISQGGFEVQVLDKSWEQAEQVMFQTTDLIIVESEKLSLEELSIFSRIRSLHKRLLTVFTDPVDDIFQVMLYEQGVDALMIKPMKPLLLAARVRALFRRNYRWKAGDNVVLNGLEINGGVRSATFDGEEIPLSSREFDLLWYLAKNSCVTIDRDRLYKNVFGVEYNGYDRSVDMYISRIRQKLSQNTNLPSPIKTVRGKGYLFTAD